MLDLGDYEAFCVESEIEWTVPEGCAFSFDGALECLHCVESWDWDVTALEVPTSFPPVPYSCNLTGMDEVCVSECDQVYDCGGTP